MDPFSQPQWPSWSYNGQNESYPGYSQMPNYQSYLADSMEVAYQNHQQHLVHHHQMSRTTESKPRLSKEEVEILEAEFQKNHKPNSTTKKALAESMRVENARINNWFQNRRAREKKENNIRKYEARQRLEREKADVDGNSKPGQPHDRDLVASTAPFPGKKDFKADENECKSEQDEPSGNDVDADGDDLDLTDSNSDLQSLSQATYSPDGHFSVDSKDSDYFFNQYQHFSRTQSVEAARASYRGSSPSSHDIAARRNRRPPPLTIGGARAYSNGVPKTAIDMGGRNEIGNSMRRVSSSNSSMRVAKPGSLPRSPFHDPKHEALFHLNRSPNMMNTRGNLAPPTPDTPIVANAPQGVRNVMNSAFALETKMAGAHVQIHDPTLRTPPSTPGLLEGMFNLQSNFDLSMSNSGADGYTGAYPMQQMPVVAPGYLADTRSSSSQPDAPNFSAQLETTYFDYPVWSDASNSGRSTPLEQAQNPIFMNLAA